MTYQVGIDLGTTYTAAAVFRDGAATIFTLGTRAAAIPSVVLLRTDGTILVGDAAERRAMSEPERVVREFKRRLGDTTPIIVGGAPYSAEALTARLLESVYDDICAREGGFASRIVITHPANWGNYKRGLLKQSVQLAGLDTAKVEFLTEPEAAALSYAAQERIDPGQVVAVYDLGGGTFDAAVLRRTPDGFSVAGRPEGIERLGGIDFDAAVFANVTSGLGSALAELDHDDPAALAAVARLRQDCVEAKEALSSDTDASVPVLLPNLATEVRITRQEFETLIRPSLLDSIEALKRAVRSADLDMTDVSRVLLVGGSSRIPLISLLVTSELGRPVAVDAHPKHAIAIGAAFAASGILDSSSDSPSPPPEDAHPRAGVDPNVTIVAPAHLYNTGNRPRLAVPSKAVPKALPIEQPSGRSSRSNSAAPQKPSAGRSARALPIESRPSEKPVVEQRASNSAPAPFPARPGKAKPIVAPRPPPGASAPADRPTPPLGESDPTSLYRPAGVDGRTQVYPGGAPPGFEPSSLQCAATQPPAKKRPGAVWFVMGLVLIALIVIVIVLVQVLS